MMLNSEREKEKENGSEGLSDIIAIVAKEIYYSVLYTLEFPKC